MKSASGNFIPYEQDQMMLFLSLDMQKLLPENHPARIINLIIEKLDLCSLYASYSHEGKPAYHPLLMLKVLFYGYYTGQISCRKMWDAVVHRADYMYLSACQVPNYRTINTFRKRHLDILPDLFTQIVMMCKECDLIGFEYLAIDGQMIRGNAHLGKNKSQKMLKKEYEKTKRGLKHVLEKELSEDYTEEDRNHREDKLQKKLNRIKSMQEKLDKIIQEVQEEDKKKLKIIKQSGEEKRQSKKLKEI